MAQTPTAGPWRDEAVTDDMALRMRGPLPQDDVVIGADGTVVGFVYDYADRTAANARLIAAAPELLAALKALVENTISCDNPSDQGVSSGSAVVVAAQAAILKAEAHG